MGKILYFLKKFLGGNMHFVNIFAFFRGNNVYTFYKNDMHFHFCLNCIKFGVEFQQFSLLLPLDFAGLDAYNVLDERTVRK